MSIFPLPAQRLFQIILLSGVILAAAVTGFCEESSEPIHIEADRMISQEEKNSVVFIGNVDASQGPVTIRTDEMTVHYTQKGEDSPAGQNSEVKKMICIGNVEITQQDWLGTGERMDYFALDRKVILSGKAKAWQGQNMISGKTIVYYLDEKRSVVEPGAESNGRVSGTFVQQSSSSKKPKKELTNKADEKTDTESTKSSEKE